jgi:hypothetical protein
VTPTAAGRTQSPWLNGREVSAARERYRGISGSFGDSLANVPAPGPEHLDHLWRDGGGEWHPHENEALVDGVGEGELRAETCAGEQSISSTNTKQHARASG